ncbi:MULTISPECIES: Hsp20/alpha crystallin family protein [Legionella]|uniref:Hsp20/alpha crystallin family protein n=1 Tax=Legionella septentrionalis TaxID=2498109 RepID=A0A3S0X5M9_9GAMM|nr:MULTISPECIES: Hsp20/alpha crystallin family protein [Legionella]MCP0914097.1 Hsp20/alpha crystallin family protein [Legionella sp. 27cVA30]RUQ90744.1 Hsp20/alpha crystallin family protein [Legionella septentrionalis]RUQ99951.1 Hsp20/alpha crystallin family protein [Legionella septentrionalis]RUR10205.1 Hsp20/alpha crystallin family protein [Legionella septentrionalis]RUR15783.1 Hsp20/alpha crystallin family protein [Legionella septentrionalis]
MALIKRDQQIWPRDYLSTMLNQFLRPFNYEEDTGTDASLWSPAVDIKETNDKYIVTADLPGVEKDDIHLSLENNALTIKGERRYEKTEEKEGFSRIERMQGQFYRRFILPETTDESKIKAKYKKGVLEIVIPKKENKSRKIEVRVEE